MCMCTSKCRQGEKLNNNKSTHVAGYSICCGFTTAKDDNNFTGGAIARLLCANALPYPLQPLLLLPGGSRSRESLGSALKPNPAKSLPGGAWLLAGAFRPRWTFNANQSSALDTERAVAFPTSHP